jgi:DNA polymerase III delta prime subunit
MVSYILIAQKDEQQKEKVSQLCDTLQINPLDRTVLTSDKETSIGIELIKKLQEKIFLKPLRSKDKAVIIPRAELLTPAAQNALLKLLEEPPAHTYIFLLAQSKEAFLPTIISRCQLLEEKIANQPINDTEKKEVKEQFASWSKQTLGDALKSAEILAKDKDKALNSLERLLVVGEVLLREEQTNQILLAQQLNQLQQTYATLKATNTNLRLTLEYLFLGLRT